MLFFGNRKKKNKKLDDAFAKVYQEIQTIEDWDDPKKLEHYILDACEQIIAITKEIEGEKAQQASCPVLNELIGENWALMSTEMLRSIDLPVQAHNVLENGISKNLWYEQNVPHQSIFYLLISRPDENSKLDAILGSNPVVQFGAGATTGYGYVKIEKK